jgi:hypothetical protein
VTARKTRPRPRKDTARSADSARKTAAPDAIMAAHWAAMRKLTKNTNGSPTSSLPGNYIAPPAAGQAGPPRPRHSSAPGRGRGRAGTSAALNH